MVFFHEERQRHFNSVSGESKAERNQFKIYNGGFMVDGKPLFQFLQTGRGRKERLGNQRERDTKIAARSI
jgi:hypothetical protein